LNIHLKAPFGAGHRPIPNPKNNRRESRIPSSPRRFVPFIRSSSLAFLTRGETKAVQCVALQLHFGMVKAKKAGDSSIHATWKEVATWAGVSYASVKRARIRLRELGRLHEFPGHRIVFDYSRDVAEMAQIEPRSNKVFETFQEECTHPEDQARIEVPTIIASGGDGLEVKQERLNASKAPSVFGAAVAVLVEAGVDRAGAVAAVKAALKAGPVDPMSLRRIAAAVAALPSKPSRPGGLLCAAVAHPEMGLKILRDLAAAKRREARFGVASSTGLGAPLEVSKAKAASLPCSVVLPPALSLWEAMRRDLREWLAFASDLEDPRDRAFIRARAEAKGYTLAQLEALPELHGARLR